MISPAHGLHKGCHAPVSYFGGLIMLESVQIKPSLTSADQLELGSAIARISRADAIHLNITDGHFCPNLTFGPALIRAVKRRSPLPVEVHIMATNPETIVQWALDAGADAVIFPIESCTSPLRLANHIKSTGARAGIALSPGTSPSTIEYCIGHFDMVLIMGVEPGFGGQALMDTTYGKVSRIYELARNTNPQLDIAVDGGVNRGNIARLAACGARSFCAGSSVFRTESPNGAIDRLRALAMGR